TVRKKDSTMDSVIARWYADQHLFITGATGFMGKVLVEKILRCCPDVGVVYILIRPKKGRDVKQRLGDFLHSPVFDKLRAQSNYTELAKKLVAVAGDVTLPECGLSPDDRRLLADNVSGVFHMAANVRFDQDLRNAALFNCGGSLNVLELACAFKKLKAFVHVSTTYCHCDELELKEKLYPAPHDARHVLELVKWMGQDLLETITPNLLKNSPNTYAYTKCLTEQLVAEYKDKLPLAIARPSIVAACHKEPIPGWVDNLNGPTGIVIGAGKGVIRTMWCNLELQADFVPVDMAINALVVIAWKRGTRPKNDEVDVYNITSSKDYCLSWGLALDLARKHVMQYPFSVMLWYPGGSAKKSYLAHVMAMFFFHLVPAYLVDFALVLTRNKPFLVRTQRRIQNGLKVLQYYALRSWTFHNDKLKEVCQELGDADRETFYTEWNDESFDADKYMLNYVLGVRKYCAHEELDTVPKARRTLRRLYYLDIMKNIILAVLLLWLFFHVATKILHIVDAPFVLLSESHLQPHPATTKNI
ncbi:hypothetical protein NQ315_000274, partial [Exocentrus adspersus]